MIKDSQLIYSDGQAITSTAASTNIVPGMDMDIDKDVFITVIATEDFAGTGTVTAHFQDCDTAGGSYATKLSGASFVANDVQAGDVLLEARLPKGLKEFTRVNYVVSGTVTAAGVDAFQAMNV